jgi:hypothetical protein
MCNKDSTYCANSSQYIIVKYLTGPVREWPPPKPANFHMMLVQNPLALWRGPIGLK